jgi:hypothetical protein
MVKQETWIIISNETQIYLNIPNGPLSMSYWISKGLVSIKGGSVLLPLLILI